MTQAAYRLVGEPAKESPTIVASGALEVDVAILRDLRAAAPAAAGPDRFVTLSNRVRKCHKAWAIPEMCHIVKPFLKMCHLAT